MAHEMKNFLNNIVKEAKDLPKGLWITALIVPGGILTLGTYIAAKSITKKQQENKNDRRENNL